MLALPDWRADRSYLWSIFAGELAVAAIALGDRPLCALLLDDLRPLAGTCAVNGALVCFMGAHAHRVGLLQAALGEIEAAAASLRTALDIHRRLGARAWQAETHAALAELGGEDAGRHAVDAAALAGELGLAGINARLSVIDPPARQESAPHAATLQKVGDMWQVSFRGRSAYLRDAKGLHDLAALLHRPGAELSALDLAGAGSAAGGPVERADPVLDRAALAAYRRRLDELDADLAAAKQANDLAGVRRASDEREQMLAELRRSTRPGGASRALGPTVTERARKAVTARIRDAIRRIAQVHPELGVHLDRTVRTGVLCRYYP